MPKAFAIRAPGPLVRERIGRSLSLFAALLLLNAMLTFHNVWPTLFIRWPGELSIELAGTLALLVAWHWRRETTPPALIAALAVLFVLGTLGRYGEVTAPALYGREVNLYWDLQHLASLAGMLVQVVPPWLLMALAAAALALVVALYLIASWSLRRITIALRSPGMNATMGVVAVAMIGWFALQRLDERVPRMPQFSIPVSQTYAKQLAKLGEALGGDAVRTLPPSPALSSTLSLSAGSDVMVVFLESYGRVAYDRPAFFQALAGERGELEAAVHETGREIISGFLESPTFGGGSWLSHLSFLSGVDVRDAAQAQLLMTQRRRSLVTEFARHGYRNVALMPGLKSLWPEGSFYGFDQIYDDAALDYRGPAFGWWRIPDQFSLAKLDALEVTPREDTVRAPLFAFFPTISTHAPFRPTPPYQADWSRLLGPHPFDEAAVRHSLQQRPDWNDMSASYLGTLAYSLQTLAGYLQRHRDQDLILIIIGDHQPAAMISGEQASWDVPVHVIASQPALLGALQACGLVPGMVPAPATLGPLYRLAPVLLAAFEAQPATPAPCQLAQPALAGSQSASQSPGV